jgi:crotonobetainyl-CoA:carnitine CoA-transferase CaiB-like acyl-CoA transferase
MTPLCERSVLDRTQTVAAPLVARVSRDLSADVAKSERHIRGDEIRAWAPPAFDLRALGVVAFPAGGGDPERPDHG